MHTDESFLSAIEAEPADRVRRLVYADWLDDRHDPRAELVRVEEEMRTLPVFADRFWELKPRRNELRAVAGGDWCARMRYGTECEPVFRHGIPDGWRDRWRLIREFTERWHRIPMPDVGGRQNEIAEAETRLERELPPSVREWIAFAFDTEQLQTLSYHFLAEPVAAPILGQSAVSLLFCGYDEIHRGVRFSNFNEADPHLEFFLQGYDANDSRIGCTPFHDPNFAPQPVSLWAFGHVLVELRQQEDTRYYDVPNPESLYPELDRLLGQRVRVGVWTLIEIENFLIEFHESADKIRHSLRIQCARPVNSEDMPEILAEILEAGLPPF